MRRLGYFVTESSEHNAEYCPHFIPRGKEAIKKELERLFPLMCEGGYIPKIDHSISSDISWDNFRYYMETLLDMHQRCANR